MNASLPAGSPARGHTSNLEAAPEFGFSMPKHHQSIVRQYPHYMAALNTVGEAAANAGPLPEKTRHLVQIGAAAAIRSEGAVHSHTRRALAAGATREEVQH